MAFRVDESACRGFESVMNYFIHRSVDVGERERSKNKLIDIADKYGPEVAGQRSSSL